MENKHKYCSFHARHGLRFIFISLNSDIYSLPDIDASIGSIKQKSNTTQKFN